MNFESSEETGEEFVVHTKGFCFICLNKTEQCPSLTSSAVSATITIGDESCSIQTLSQFIRLDRRKLFTAEAPIPLDLLKKAAGANLKVELCKKCASINQEFVHVYGELEKLKKNVIKCLVKLYTEMKVDSNQGGGRFEELRKFLMSEIVGNNEGITNNQQRVFMFEELRKEMMRKCLIKLKNIQAFGSELTLRRRAQLQKARLAASSSAKSLVSATATSTPLPNTNAINSPSGTAPRPIQKKQGTVEEVILSDSDDDAPIVLSPVSSASPSTKSQPQPSSNIAVSTNATASSSPTNVGTPIDSEATKQKKAFAVKRFACKVCRKHFPTPIELEKHGVQAHAALFKGKLTYPCTQCNFQIETFKKLQMHINLVHSGNSSKEFKCGYCPESFSTRILAETHLKQTHPIVNSNPAVSTSSSAPIVFTTSVPVSIKNKSSNTALTTSSVQLFHLQPTQTNSIVSQNHQPLQQQQLTSISLNSTNSSEKITFHRGEDDAVELNTRLVIDEHAYYKCEICNKIFDTQNALKIHFRDDHYKVHESLQYKCSYCPSIFDQESMLTVHSKVRHPTLPCLNQWVTTETTKVERTRKQVLISRVLPSKKPGGENQSTGSRTVVLANPMLATLLLNPQNRNPAQSVEVIDNVQEEAVKTTNEALEKQEKELMREELSTELSVNEEEKQQQQIIIDQDPLGNGQSDQDYEEESFPVISTTHSMAFVDESAMPEQDYEENAAENQEEEEEESVMDIGDVKLFSGPSLSSTFPSLSSKANTKPVECGPHSSASTDKIKELVARGPTQYVKLKCDECTSTFVTKSGLLSHIRCRHSGKRPNVKSNSKKWKKVKSQNKKSRLSAESSPGASPGMTSTNLEKETTETIQTTTEELGEDSSEAKPTENKEVVDENQADIPSESLSVSSPEKEDNEDDKEKPTSPLELPTEPTSVEETYLCNMCQTSLASEEELENHKKLSHNTQQPNPDEEEILVDNAELLVKQEEMKCTFCGLKFEDPQDLQEHVKIAHQQYKCNYCSETFAKKGRAEIHMNLHHRRKQ